MNYTEEYVKKQVAIDGWFLSRKDIPEELKTDEVCRIAVENAEIRRENSESILCFVPQEKRTYDLCFAAVLRDGTAIRDVPLSHRTHDLCMEAVRFEGGELDQVPLSERDKIICELAVSSNGWAILDVPRNLWSSTILKLAVRNAPNVLKVLPPEVVTNELHVMALRKLEQA